MKFGWIDFSSEARNAASAALNALHEKGAVDELGIGVVRDAFSAVFFPGTSTQQTRPKYFVLVPRAIRAALERVADGNVIDSVTNELRRQEYRCAERLWDSVGNKTGSGVIGATRLGHGWRNWVASPPSAIYWSGLRTFGIIDCLEGDSLRLFLKNRDSLARKIGRRDPYSELDDEEDGMMDAKETNRARWRTGFDIPIEILGDVSSDWTKDITMN